MLPEKSTQWTRYPRSEFCNFLDFNLPLNIMGMKEDR